MQRQAPLRGEGFGEGSGRLSAEAGVGAFGVVVRAPGGLRDAGMVQGREQGFFQQFISEAAVEAFDEGILGRLSPSRGLQANRCRASGRDLFPVKLAIIHKLQNRVRGELGPIIADNPLGLAAGVEQGRQFPRHPSPRQ